ncbi:rhomboid family intramembrane serine protease [Thermogutta sp.]|uniref:rhomboid family intramembrane serine protease n=2 Tax=Thermogutta sp. TaxID=1962930 RepID=UPI0032202856
MVRGRVPKNIASQLWQRAKEQKDRHGDACPLCHRPMAVVPIVHNEHTIPIDLCPNCYLAWFDRTEWEALPQAPPSVGPPNKELSPAAREAIARAKIEQLARRDQANEDLPSEPWQWIPAFFGLPVEVEGPALRSIPWLTWGTVVACVLVFLYSLQNLGVFVQQLGFIPAQPFRLAGLTLLTSFFLHGGIFHLIGNMYFLLVFGDNVEDHVGRWFYLALLVLAHVTGLLFHALGDPRVDIPCVGASAGISGAIVFYGLQFPKAKLGILFRYFFWLRFPAVWGLVAWVVLQVLTAYSQLSGASDVSALAHLGGSTVGMIAWMLWKNQILLADWFGLPQPPRQMDS